MSSSSKRFLLRRPVVVVDTGCRCRSSKIASFFSLSSLQKQRNSKMPFLSNSQSDLSSEGPQFSSIDESQSSSSSPREKKQILKKKMKKKKGVEQSVAVVKESLNPYVDFRQSMMVMIVEKEIYSWDGLCELLNQFLSLNSVDNHHHILSAFSEIWNEVFSPFSGGF